jgi:hypothetical protein
LNEVSPHLGDVDLHGLLAMIPANVLPRDTVETLADRYDEMPEHQGGATGLEAFAALYETGLLGVVHTDPLTGDKVQRFLNAGDSTFGVARSLPLAPYYLVRSVLSGHMAAINPEYAGNTDRSNVIGSGRAWREPAARPDSVPAYRGDSQYVHVCYSHQDTPIVLREIAWLARRGINVWYDEGIPAGSRWTEHLAARIRNASALLFFASESSVVSHHCVNEISFASDVNKPVVVVQIGQAEIPDGLRLMIGAKQSIRAFGSATTSTYRPQIESALLEHHTK